MNLREIEETMDNREQVQQSLDRLDRLAFSVAVVAACVFGMITTALAAWLW